METIIQRLGRQLSRRVPVWHFPHEQTCYSLQQLHHWGLDCAARLRDQGIGAGMPVGLALNNGPVYVALLLGLWHLNAIPVPLRPYGGKGFGYASYLRDVDAVCRLQCLVRDPQLDARPFEPWQQATGKTLFTGDQFTGDQFPYADTAGPIPDQVAGRPDDIAVLQMTSGTTSRPKAVVVTHEMVMQQLACLSGSGELYAGDTVASAASWLPLNHDMGLFTGVLWPLYDGSDNLLGSPAFYMRNPKRWFSLLSEAGTTMNFATNTSAVAACKVLGRSHRLSGIDLSRLHLYFGAEKLNAGVLRQTIATLQPLGLDPGHIHMGYGMAENALAATRSPRGRPRQLQVGIGPDDRVSLAPSESVSGHEHSLVSVGEAMPGYRIAIRDARGRDLPELRIGEVHLAGPCISPGYYRDPEQTRLHFRDGLFRTGDLGFIHGGELYFISRTDDLVNIGGRKLIPDDIEHTVEAFAGRSCLLGIDSRDGLTVPLLLVEASQELDQETSGQLVNRVRAAVLDHHDLLVADVVLCEKGSIERTSSGKKRRKVIRQRYLDGEIKRANRNPSPRPLSRQLQAEAG